MKYLPMNRRGLVPIKVPQLNGGVNLYDIPAEAADNQLTACENVWWHKGALRTRPGYKKTYDIYYAFGKKQMLNEREMLITSLVSRGGLQGNFLNAYHVDVANGVRKIGVGGSDVIPGDTNQTVLGFRAPSEGNDDWYFLLSGGTIMRGSSEERGTIDIMDPYTPIVVMNGHGDDGASEENVDADMYQDFNMLSRCFKAQYTTDGKSQYWRLPDNDLGLDESGQYAARVKLTLEGAGEPVAYLVDMPADGTVVEREISAAELGVPAEQYDDLKIRFRFDRANGYLYTKVLGKPQSQSGEITTEQGVGYLPRVTSNNLEITAWRNEKYEKNRQVICKMTRCVWYGGSRSGIAGGTRLFVCGNPDEPNLMHWSGIEHPLYFPEHNYNRIGDASQALTAFGKPGELLIIFKEHQMYAAQYADTEQDDYDLAKGNVAITTYMAMFPVTPLHDTLGCDCPESVRLVNNRLVWANSDGHVYMLTATNQFSERNVRDISRNITADMALQGDMLKNAVAGEYEGYYLLAVGARMYLLDTQNSAFASFNYYSSEDAARKALPWYIWQLPFPVYGMVSDGHRVLIAPHEQSYGVMELGGEMDGEQPIKGHFATKMFDFGLVDRTKSVGQMYMGVEMAADGRLALTYLSEKGNRHDPYEIDGGDMAEFHGEGCMRYMRFTPHMHLVQTFGFRADITSAVAVDGITIKVKQQGVVR